MKQIKIIAVVGVSRNPKKYGYKIWKSLKEKGYEVYGINPNAEHIDGEKIYDDLNSLPKQPDVVDFVVPPQIAYQILKNYATKHKNVIYWFQPGSESDKAKELCKKLNLKCVFNFCLMEESKKNNIIDIKNYLYGIIS